MPKAIVDVVVLRLGDVLVLNDANFQITQGQVECRPDGYKCITNTTTLNPIVLEEAYALHDEGKTVFEISDSFTGLWRE